MLPSTESVPVGAAFLLLSLFTQFTSASVLGRNANGILNSGFENIHVVVLRDTNSTTAVSTTASETLSTTTLPDLSTTTASDTFVSSTTVEPTSTVTTETISTTEESTTGVSTTDTGLDTTTVSTTGVSTTDTGLDTTTATTTAESTTGTTTAESTTGTTTSLTISSFPSSTTASTVPSSTISVTSAPSGTSAAAAAATSSASSVSSQVAIIIPFIQSWTKDADNLKDDTLNKVKNLINGVENAISDLGGDKSAPCKPKKRGLLSFVSDVINTLACVVSNLDDVTSKINIGDVTGITPVITELTAVNSELEEEGEEEDEDETKTNESQTETESDASTATSEASTTSVSSETVTSTTTSGSCLMRETTNLQPPTNTVPTATFVEPTDVTSDVTSETGTATSVTSVTSGETTTTSGAVTTTTSGVASTTTSDGTTTATSDATSETTTSDGTTSVTSDATSETTVTSDTVTSDTTTSVTSITSATTTSGVSSTMSTVPSTFQTSTTAAAEADPICIVHSGPTVPEPFCQCETVSASQTFFATTALISGQCSQYTSFPSEITLAPTTTAEPTTAPPTPLIETEANGDVLSYPSQTVEYGVVGNGVSITMTKGLGTPVTIETPLPTQTDGNHKGSSNCGSIDDACDRAYMKYEDDTVYTDYTAYTADINSGILVALTFGEAGCTAMFECDDYGIGMTGKDIKDAVQYMKDNDGVGKCGSTYLSNSCHVTLNYCTSCKATQ